MGFPAVLTTPRWPSLLIIWIFPLKRSWNLIVFCLLATVPVLDEDRPLPLPPLLFWCFMKFEVLLTEAGEAALRVDCWFEMIWW